MICFNPDDESEDQPILPIYLVSTTVLYQHNQEPIRLQIYTQDDVNKIQFMHIVPAQIRQGTLQYIFKENLLSHLQKHQRDKQFKLLSGFVYPNSLTQLKEVQLFAQKLLNENKVAVFETHAQGRLILLHKNILQAENQFKSFSIPYNIVTKSQLQHEPQVLVSSYGNISSSLACLMYNKDICSIQEVNLISQPQEVKVLTQNELSEFVRLNKFNSHLELISSDSGEDSADIDIVEYINSFVPKKPKKITEEMKELHFQQNQSISAETLQCQEKDSQRTPSREQSKPQLIQQPLSDEPYHSQLFNLGEHQIVFQNQNTPFQLITDEYPNYFGDIIQFPKEFSEDRLRKMSFQEFSIGVQRRRDSHMFKQVAGTIIPVDQVSSVKLTDMVTKLANTSSVLTYYNYGINQITFLHREQLATLQELGKTHVEGDSKICFLIEQIYGFEVAYVRATPFKNTNTSSPKDINS